MIARIPLLLCLLAASSAAFAEPRAFKPKSTVLSMTGGAQTPAAAGPVPSLKVSFKQAKIHDSYLRSDPETELVDNHLIIVSLFQTIS